MRVSGCTKILFSTPANILIQTTLGPVEGFKYFNSSTTEKFWNISDSNVTAFLGIPYAATTGGDNRWKAPQPRASVNISLFNSRLRTCM